MSFLEHFLDLRWNPVNILARHNALGLGGMVNKFNQASELLDDLNDHWCANTHKPERNWLVLECQKLALEMHARVSFLSGDVHLAAVGCLRTKPEKYGHGIRPEEDHRYMVNVITSAIVNTPPPPGAATMVSILGGHKHRTLRECRSTHPGKPDRAPRTDDERRWSAGSADAISTFADLDSGKDDTDEIMIPLFNEDTDGKPLKRKVRAPNVKNWIYRQR
jgi:hypothetical protein